MSDLEVRIPARLRPYLEDLRQTGLYGTTLRQTVVLCVERHVRREVCAGFIPLRRWGKVWRWLRP